MVVAVAVVLMVEVAVDEVVDVIAMGNGLVSTAVAVYVGRVVCAAGMTLRAVGRVGIRNFDSVLVDVVVVRVM